MNQTKHLFSSPLRRHVTVSGFDTANMQRKKMLRQHKKTHVLWESCKLGFFKHQKQESSLNWIHSKCHFGWIYLQSRKANWLSAGWITVMQWRRGDHHVVNSFVTVAQLTSMSSSNATNKEKKLSEHMEPEEGWEPSHISRTHDGKWHICCVLRSDRNVVERDLNGSGGGLGEWGRMCVLT